MRKNPLASALAAAAIGVVGIAGESNAIRLEPDNQRRPWLPKGNRRGKFKPRKRGR